MKKLLLIPGVVALLGCEAGPASAPHPLQPGLGALRELPPLGVRAPLPAGAKVEDLSAPGMPRRVGITSADPELVFDVEEVDDLSPTQEQIAKLGTARVIPGDTPRLERSEKGDDGTFTVVVQHAGSVRSYAVDLRVSVGRRQLDCTGTASSREVVDRLVATCQALQGL